MGSTIVFVISFLVGIFTTCTKNNVLAGGTDTGNAKVIGKLRNPDGSPASSAIVRFVKSDEIPSYKIQAKKTAIGYSAITDENGEYGLDSLPQGYYSVLGEKGTLLSYMDSAYVPADSHIVVPDDTLKEPGSLSGVIHLENNDDARKVIILILGTNTFTAPKDSIGNFTLANMAEGKYHVRILPTLDNYLQKDTLFTIQAGESDTLTDTIKISLKRLEMPQNISVSPRDFIGGSGVNISWNSVHGAVFYNIYRNTNDTGTYEYVGKTIDTTRDGGETEHGTIYYYEIQASNGVVNSPYSAYVSVLTVPAAPESVWATAIKDSSILLKWTKAKSAISYKIYRSKGNNFSSFDSLGITSDTFFTATGVDYRTNHCYHLKAVNPSGDSPFSWPETTIPLGTIAYTQRFLHAADFPNPVPVTSSTNLTLLYNSSGLSLGIKGGDIITMFAYTTLGVKWLRNLAVVDSVTGYNSGAWDGQNANSYVVTYDNFITELRKLINVISVGSLAMFKPNGSVEIDNTTGAGNIVNLQITSNRSGGSSGYISRAFSFPSTIGTTATDIYYSDTLRIYFYRPAIATDFIADLYDANKNKIGGLSGLEDGATISINGAVGGITIQPGIYTYSPATSTLGNLLEAIRVTFNLPVYDGTPDSNFSVSIAQENLEINEDKTLGTGSIVIRGRSGRIFSITNISIQASDPNQFNEATPTRFNGNMGVVEVRSTRD